MIRLLIIGRPGSDWARRLRKIATENVDIAAERLPSAGIRAFQEHPADLIVVADDRGGDRVEILAQAIRQRPLGRLVPLLLVCPLPDDDAVDDKIAKLDLVDWLPPDVSPDALCDTVDEALDADLRTADGDADDSPSVASPESGPDGSVSYFDGDVVLEPLDEPASPRRVQRSDLFRRPTNVDDGDEPVGAEEIERKLKAVRHDDYYTILEVRRGAESQPVREAFHRLQARFDPASLDFQLVRKYQDEIAEIRDALEDAFAVLGDPELRRAYREHTLR